MQRQQIENTIVRGLIEGKIEMKVYLIDCPYPSTPLQVPIDEFVSIGIIKRTSGLRKLEKWLNSDDGKEFLINKIQESFDWTNDVTI